MRAADPSPSDAMRRAMTLTGGTIVVCLLANTLLSPYIESGRRTMFAPWAFFLLSFGPTAAASVAFVVLIHRLARMRAAVDAGMVRYAFGWSVVFAVVAFCAVPWQTQDVWYSVAWGRMVVDGLNPYHVDVPAAFLADLPNPAAGRMAYGPAWAVVAAVLMAMGGGLGMAAAWLVKVVLLAAWLGSVLLIRALLADQDPWRQYLGVVVYGWLPPAVLFSVAEAHNDVAMGFFVLLWLYLKRRQRPVLAGLSLATAVLTKYVVAPLFLLDLLSPRGAVVHRLKQYAPVALAVTALAVLLFGVFYRSTEFFDPILAMRWDHFRPLVAVADLLDHLAVPWRVRGALQFGLVLALPLAAVWAIGRFCLQGTDRNLCIAALAVMMAMLLSNRQHVWPWYIIWVLPLAALVPGSLLARLAVGLALGFQLLIPVWLAFGEIDGHLVFRDAPIVAYATGLLFAWTFPRELRAPALAGWGPRTHGHN